MLVRVACSRQSRISSGLLADRQELEQLRENLPLTGGKASPAEQDKSALPLQHT